MLCLTIEHAGRRRHFPLGDLTKLRLGRAPDNDVVLDADTISWHHAQVSVDGSTVSIEDLGSRNGTYIAGRRIEKETTSTPVAFRLGAKVRAMVSILDTKEVAPAPDVAPGTPIPTSAPRATAELPTQPGPMASDTEDLAPALLTALACRDPSLVVREVLRATGRTLGVESALALRGAHDTQPALIDAIGTPSEFGLVSWRELTRMARSDHRWGEVCGWAWAAAASDDETTAIVLNGADEDRTLKGLPLVADALVAARPSRSKSTASKMPGAQPTFVLEHPDGSLVSGEASSMRALHAALSGAITSDLPVLLLGETGTGKEVHARALHAQSHRSAGPFRAVNASALPHELLEPLLFGVEDGVATGVRRQPGLMREADGGTLFLDEVADMSKAVQAKLLRALDQREVLPLGASTPVPVDVRLIAATNRSLPDLMKSGDFRPDLYFRLRGHEVEIPPLRDRREDIPLLTNSFLRSECKKVQRRSPGMTMKAVQLLMAHAWPGNVRELETLTRRLVHEHPGNEPIGHESLPPEFQGDRRSPPTGLDARIDAFQAPLIREALAAAGGNRTHAAEMLNISRQRLRALMKRFGIDERRG